MKDLYEKQVDKLSREEQMEFYRNMRDGLVNFKEDYYTRIKKYIKNDNNFVYIKKINNKAMDFINDKIYKLDNITANYCKFIHPKVKELIKKANNMEIDIINEEKLKINKPTIYVVNHSNCHDFPTMCEIAQDHFVLFAGVQKLRLIDRFGFFLNKVIYVDRKNPKNSKLRLVNILKNGHDLIIFSEATWNTHESKLMLPMYWGAIDIAKKSGANIKPIFFDYNKNHCTVEVGDDITVKENDCKQKKFDELRDSLSTMSLNAIERKGIFKRENITIQDYYSYSKDRYEEYPKLDVK